MRKMIIRAIALLVVAGLAAGVWVYTGQARTPDFADVAYGRTSPSQTLDI